MLPAFFPDTLLTRTKGIRGRWGRILFRETGSAFRVFSFGNLSSSPMAGWRLSSIQRTTAVWF